MTGLDKHPNVLIEITKVLIIKKVKRYGKKKKSKQLQNLAMMIEPDLEQESDEIFQSMSDEYNY